MLNGCLKSLCRRSNRAVEVPKNHVIQLANFGSGLSTTR